MILVKSNHKLLRKAKVSSIPFVHIIFLRNYDSNEWAQYSCWYEYPNIIRTLFNCFWSIILFPNQNSCPILFPISNPIISFEFSRVKYIIETTISINTHLVWTDKKSCNNLCVLQHIYDNVFKIVLRILQWQVR